jgi:hypothetical protein
MRRNKGGRFSLLAGICSKLRPSQLFLLGLLWRTFSGPRGQNSAAEPAGFGVGGDSQGNAGHIHAMVLPHLPITHLGTFQDVFQDAERPEAPAVYTVLAVVGRSLRRMQRPGAEPRPSVLASKQIG